MHSSPKQNYLLIVKKNLTLFVMLYIMNFMNVNLIPALPLFTHDEKLSKRIDQTIQTLELMSVIFWWRHRQNRLLQLY